MHRKLTDDEIKQLEKTIAPQGFKKFAKENKKKRKRDFNDEEIDKMLQIQKQIDAMREKTPKINPLSEIEIYREKTDKNLLTLDASINSEGQLVISGFDIGELCEEVFKKDDYEYTYTIDKKYKDTLLLLLLKERLGDSSISSSSFLNQTGVPYEFWSY